MSEKIDWKNLRDKLTNLSKNRVERIENPMVPGMFDLNYCIDGVEGWIELKSPTEPVRATTPLFGSNHKLSRDQMNWCLKQQQAGGNAWILISTNKHWLLINGREADFINTMTMPELISVASWTAAKPIRGKVEWEMLKTQLKTNQ